MTTSLSLTEGAEVRCGDRSLVVRQAVGFDAVVVEDPETGEIERLGIADLRPGTAEAADSSSTNLNDFSAGDWAEARRRRDLIAPLLDGTRCPRSIVVERARAGDCATTTLYRWARLYRASGRLSSLLPEQSSGGRGKSRLNPVVEQILTQTIEDYYLSRQQRTIRSTAQEVARRCREASLHAPNPNTVRLRILALPMRERLRRRSHRKEATDRFTPRPGTFDLAQRPLDIVQIDHTKLDIIVGTGATLRRMGARSGYYRRVWSTCAGALCVVRTKAVRCVQ